MPENLYPYRRAVGYDLQLRERKLPSHYGALKTVLGQKVHAHAVVDCHLRVLAWSAMSGKYFLIYRKALVLEKLHSPRELVI